MNPVIAMIHDTKGRRWHPVLFLESPAPGPPSDDKPVRHKSKMHHTAGFPTREEALANARGDLARRVAEHFGPPRFALSRDFEWDGDGVPALVAFFAEDFHGELVVAC